MRTQASTPAYPPRPPFMDAASCVVWLDKLALLRLSDAHEMVSAQIGLIRQAQLPALECFHILELLCHSAARLQAEMARRYIGGALPLSIVEYSVWNAVVELWQSMFKGYQLCLSRGLTNEPDLARHVPLLALRCIEHTAAAIKEYHRVYREVASALWRQLHASYAEAERHGLVSVGVTDPLSATLSVSTCMGTYVGSLLAHLSNPYTMPPRQLSVMYRWTEQWESLAGISTSAIAPGTTPVLAVDLHSDAPAMAARRMHSGPSVRYIATEQLGEALRRVLGLLRQGHEPASLGLGEDSRQPGSERLLTLLYIQWCGSGMGRLARARERGEDARACVGLHGVQRQLGSAAEAFRTDAVTIRAADVPFTEQWYVTSINAPGFIGVARGSECDQRIEHHQLVAIKRRGASNFQLAVAQWLKLEDDGDLSIGLRLLPGIPCITALRPVDGCPQAGDQTVAILLPAAPDVRLPATLVLEPGLFRPGREFEMSLGSTRRVRLIRLSERGVDFERAVFERVA